MRRILPALALGACVWLTGATHPQPADAPDADATAEAATAASPETAAEAAEAAAQAATQPAAEAAAAGAATQGGVSVVDTPATGATETTVAPSRPRTPQAVELASAKGTFHERLAELTAAASAATDGDQALSLQRQIQQLKLDTEIAYLEIQARHARALGNEQLAAEAEAVIRAARATAERPIATTAPQSVAPAPGAQAPSTNQQQQ